MWPRTGFNLKSDVTVYVAIRPQKINVIFSQGKAKIGEPINITCESEGVPEPRFTITHNNTEVIAGKTYNIPQVKWSDGGLYECIAKSKFGIGSKCHCLTVLGGASSSTKVDRDVADNIVVWHIVVSLILGIVIGCLLSYIVSCSRRKFTSKKPRQPNPEPSKPEVDKTYQELDLTKMNKEENYQSLTVNQPAKNDNRNEDGSNYTELSQTREAEKTYQSLT
ncbi:uncharacterized protein LOC114522833 isoform X2 [Dendronephthya gigantea]|nr:uncharacterized protein LOC114522833 isoform X2 [Dendronephthya gigantea]